MKQFEVKLVNGLLVIELGDYELLRQRGIAKCENGKYVITEYGKSLLVNKSGLTVEEKLKRLNKLEVVDLDADGETCYYVLVEDNTRARVIIDSLGFNASDYAVDLEYIDISQIAWTCGADWHDVEKFLVDRPDMSVGA